MRLNRYLALCGLGSRRKCDEIILQNRVEINGKPAEQGRKVFPGDEVRVDGKVVSAEEKMYFLFYKPLNVLTTLSDPRGRPTIADYLKKAPTRLFPVGRLDFDSEGLLFLTNDGALAHKTQHPKYEIEKEYLVKTRRKLTAAEKKQFQEGLELEEGTTSRATLEFIEELDAYRVILHQGWYRQIRRMFDVFQVEVTALKRIRIGNLSLDDMKPGELREIPSEQVRELRKILQ
jgi:pseudouridine synthase